MNEIYEYDAGKLKEFLSSIVQKQVSPDQWNWINEKANGGTKDFRMAFASIPRKTGKATIVLQAVEQEVIQELRKGFTIDKWTTDRLCRVWLLLHVPTTGEDDYVKAIDSLFLAAEMNELVALYSALPLLAYPSAWRKRCAEGIRSNIGDVLEAIICNNPYPSEQLDQKAWNQLVLKAFFTEKPVNQIVQLDKRGNEELAFILCDYAHERWAAGRIVNPLLWRCVGKFVDESIFPDVQKIFNSGKSVECEAAALACWDSTYGPAKKMLDQRPDLKLAIEDGKLNWDIIAQRIHSQKDQ